MIECAGHTVLFQEDGVIYLHRDNARKLVCFCMAGEWETAEFGGEEDYPVCASPVVIYPSTLGYEEGIKALILMFSHHGHGVYAGKLYDGSSANILRIRPEEYSDESKRLGLCPFCNAPALLEPSCKASGWETQEQCHSAPGVRVTCTECEATSPWFDGPKADSVESAIAWWQRSQQ